MLGTDEQNGWLAGRVAKHLGVGVQTLHFYEREGLIAEAPRTPSGYRVYPPALVERLRFIKQAQSLGLPLLEIKEILLLAARGKSPCGRVQAALTEKLAEVDRRLIELRRFRRDLAKLIGQTAEDFGSRKSGDVCAIVERSNPSRAMTDGNTALRKVTRRRKSR